MLNFKMINNKKYLKNIIINYNSISTKITLVQTGLTDFSVTVIFKSIIKHFRLKTYLRDAFSFFNLII